MAAEENLTLLDDDEEATGGYEEPKPLSIEEVKGIVELEISNAVGGDGTEIAARRRMALRYYHGRPFGNEMEGRSSVVMTDVRDTVEWTMPSLMRMFAGGPAVGRYQPKRMDAVEQAEQATEYINHVFTNELDGFRLLYDGFKTGLIENAGFFKVYIEERVEPAIETYNGLDEEQLQVLLSEEGVVPIAIDSEEQATGELDETGQPIKVKLYDVQIKTLHLSKKIRVDGIPPEEFIYARRMNVLDDYSPFCAHRKKVTLSDLIAMGYPKEVVYALPRDDSPEFNEARVERRSDDEDDVLDYGERADVASREIWITDCYMRIDEDGDGYAELRHIVAVGDTSLEILEDEEVNWNPFVMLCPIPMPHRLTGLSEADLVMDMQLIRSSVARQMLDNMYLTNNARLAIVEGNVEIDDLLVSRPGGLVRQTAPGQIEPIETPQLSASAYNLLEYLDTVRENRTGITRYNQGMDATSLNQTATGINAIMNASQGRLELLARCYAVGLKRLYKLMLRMMVEGGFRKRVVRLRGEWVEVDPSTWDADMDVDVEVGLGVNQATERIQYLYKLIELQGEVAARGGKDKLVTLKNIYNAASRLTEAMGFNIPDLFFVDPDQQRDQEEPPDPEMVKIQAQAKIEEGKAMLKQKELATQEFKEKQIADFRVREHEDRMQFEREKLEKELALKREELDQKERIERDKAKAQRAAAAAAKGMGSSKQGEKK